MNRGTSLALLCAALTLAACGRDHASAGAPADSAAAATEPAAAPAPIINTATTQAAQRGVDTANASAARTQNAVDSLSNAANP